METVVFVTLSRADWPKMLPLVRAAREICNVRVVCGGDHRYSNTYQEVADDCPEDFYLLPAFVGSERMPDAIAGICEEVANVCERLKPRLTFVHGDRFEAMGAALGVVASGHRLAHVEGGIVTGAIDNSFRHAISKLAHCHFVDDHPARRRLEQLGERRIYVTGPADLHTLSNRRPQPYSFWIGGVAYPYAYASWHYDSLISPAESASQLGWILTALGKEGLPTILNLPEARSFLLDVVREHREDGQLIHITGHRSHEDWHDIVASARVLIGNSSGFVTCSQIVGTPAVVVGTRQLGRWSSSAVNVHHVEARTLPLLLGGLLSNKWIEKPVPVLNTPELFSVALILELENPAPLQKEFYDL